MPTPTHAAHSAHRPRFSRLAILSLALVALLGALRAFAASGEARHPMAVQAESDFFAVFTTATTPSDEALRSLMTAYFVDPDDARTNLLLGLNHLWLAAEGDRSDPRVIEHLYLAERFLARTRERDPGDERLASWLLPARMALARIEQQWDRLPTLSREMASAYARDPNFHAFVVGSESFAEPRDSEAFVFGLEAMRAALGCAGAEDPSCRNEPHWQHNLEAFLVLAADFETKVGQVDRARALLERVRTVPDFASWPYRDVVDQRLAALDQRAARYADQDEDNDPPSFFGARAEASCQACHRAR